MGIIHSDSLNPRSVLGSSKLFVLLSENRKVKVMLFVAMSPNTQQDQFNLSHRSDYFFEITEKDSGEDLEG